MGERKPSSTGRALYRAYRSHDFDEVVGQDHVVATLRHAVKDGRIAHAYLFTGPRGVGKTSVARILAHAINDKPYKDESLQLDIIEIDAASNRGIDEIRELRDKVHIAPASYRYKVYIIDEVHMLTTPAFNALLKTLEEPPQHAVFILATTEAHKVPETITSRTQRFSFKPIAPGSMTKHLADIAKQEKIEIEAPALELIAKHARGSLRDAIGFLDQLSSAQSKVATVDVINLLGLAPTDQLNQLEAGVSTGDVQTILSTLSKLYDIGASPIQIASQLIDIEREKLQTNQTADIELMTELLKVSTAREPDLMLEVVLSRQALAKSAAATNKTASPEASTHGAKSESKSLDQSLTSPTKSKAPDPITAPVGAGLNSAQWAEVLEQVKASNNSLYAVLRLAKIEDTGQNLNLVFGFDFHKARAEESRNRQLLESVLVRVTGKTLAVQVMTDKTLQTKPAQSDALMSVIGVMGGGSVVEYEDG